MFDNTLEVANNVWIWTWMLEWTPEEASLLQDRLFSAVASVYISREAWETQIHCTFFQHQSTGYLRTRGQECMRLALHVHYRPFSVTSEESLLHVHYRPFSVTSEESLLHVHYRPFSVTSEESLLHVHYRPFSVTSEESLLHVHYRPFSDTSEESLLHVHYRPFSVTSEREPQRLRTTC